jgi:hypothetical protein
MPELDIVAFNRACKRYIKKYCKNKKTALKKLYELGFIDEEGNIHKNYK